MSNLSSWHLSGVLIFFLLIGPILGEDSDIIRGAVHTITSVECRPYFSFQMLALAFSHKRVGMPGPLTRIMACSPETRKKISQEEMEVMNTHITPQYAHDAVLDDFYSPYNKPGSILHWLEHVEPKEEWLLMVDPDIIFRHPVLPSEFHVPAGWARAAHYSYLKGTSNELADKHIPDVIRRMDNNGGRPGRRADEAGSFYFMRMEDMRRVAPLWMNFTRDVRADPDAWRLSGDQYAKKGQPVWISEMYGWAFAMAKNDVWHLLEPILQVYPGGVIRDVPKLTHYGLNHKALNFSFDKHHHLGFDFTRCPPWNLANDRGKKEDAGLFPHPPSPHEIVSDHPGRRYGELLTIEFVNTLNEALCEQHRRKCVLSRELVTECGKVENIRDALKKEFNVLDKIVCRDANSTSCQERKELGHCKDYWLQMGYFCRKTCGLCSVQPLLEGKDTAPKVQQESTADHEMRVSSGEFKSKPDEDSGKFETKSVMHETKCGNMTVDDMRRDPECVKQDVQHGLDSMDFKHMIVQEQEPSKDANVSFFLISTLSAVALGWFLSRFYSRRNSQQHHLSTRRQD